MRVKTICSTSVAIMLASIMVAASAQAVETDAVGTLLGPWGGSGRITYTDGSTEGISCTADYTGGGKELRMGIRCKSERNPIEIRSKLRIDGARASGEWEERTFNASGSAAGTAGTNSLSIRIEGGGLTGSMVVSFSKSSHTILISTQGIAMRGVKVSFGRR